MRLKTPRYDPVADADLTPAQTGALETLNPAARGLNLFRTAVRAPEAMRSLLTWGNYIQGRASDLAPREKEIVILRTGYLCLAGYEWAQHVILGRRAGLSDEDIAALKAGASDRWSAKDQALIRAADDLHNDTFISEPVWAALCAHFTDKQRMDIVFTAGHYTQVCMILNTFGVQLDPGLTLDPDLTAYAD